jgi:hypothetical protein
MRRRKNNLEGKAGGFTEDMPALCDFSAGCDFSVWQREVIAGKNARAPPREHFFVLMLCPFIV